MRRELLILASATVVLAGCSGDTDGTAPSGALTTYFDLVFSEHAINMAVTDPVHHSNTFQLVATPLNAYGDPVPDSGHVSFHLADTSDTSVMLSASGLVTARAPTKTGGALVVASLRLQNVTHVDTAIIRVTATAPNTALASFSLLPETGTDTVVPLSSGNYVPRISAYNSDNTTATFGSPASGNDIFYLTGSDRSKASSNIGSPYEIMFLRVGPVTLYATSWVYGVAVKDSLTITVTYPMSFQVSVFKDFTRTSSLFLTSGNHTAVGGTVTLGIATGGTINWINQFGDTIDVVFDDSTAVDSAADQYFGTYSGGGNVHFHGGSGFDAIIQARRFPHAGNYHFYNPRYPTIVGTIAVRDNPT